MDETVLDTALSAVPVYRIGVRFDGMPMLSHADEIPDANTVAWPAEEPDNKRTLIEWADVTDFSWLAEPVEWTRSDVKRIAARTTAALEASEAARVEPGERGADAGPGEAVLDEQVDAITVERDTPATGVVDPQPETRARVDPPENPFAPVDVDYTPVTRVVAVQPESQPQPDRIVAHFPDGDIVIDGDEFWFENIPENWETALHDRFFDAFYNGWPDLAGHQIDTSPGLDPRWNCLRFAAIGATSIEGPCPPIPYTPGDLY